MTTSTTQTMEELDAVLRRFFHVMKRPHAWSVLNDIAGTSIDRPAATILLLITSDSDYRYHLHDLAHRLNIEAPSVTRKVQQLEANGLIVRQQEMKDRRLYNIEATPKGRDIATKIRNAQRAVVTMAVKTWPPGEQTMLVTLLDRFTQGLTEVYDQPQTLHQQLSDDKGNL